MKFSRALRFVGIVIIGAALSQQGFPKGKVYTWTDNKGVVHYGEHPPKDAKATLVRTRTGHSEPTPAQTAMTQPKPDTNPAPTPVEPSFKDPERCAKAKENLAMLNSVARIRTQNAEGVTVFMTEEEKANQRKTTQLVVDQACE